MKDLLFIIDANDGLLTIKCKTEANVKLASVNKHPNVHNPFKDKQIEELHQLVALAKTLDDHNTTTNSHMIPALLNIITIIKKGVLYPLTLKADEFVYNEDEDVYINNRYFDVCKLKHEDKFVYINTNAFVTKTKAFYNHYDKQQIDSSEIGFINTYPTLYITKGGVVTGEYIKHCYILDEDVSVGKFTKTIPIEIPVSVITSGLKNIYTVDSREPKFKEVLKSYSTPILIDDSIKGLYDIRKYTKLNK